ncbi:MAG TPA: hypothetical protein VNN55_07235 [bacterium]|nr:hypothetical protein [bacterium]
MPFFVYSVDRDESRAAFTCLREIRLAGKSSALASFVRKKSPTSAPYTWHADETALISEIEKATADKAIIIDLKPRDLKAVSLFRLHDVWGYSQSEWTVLMLRLEDLYIDHPVADPARFKERFASPEAKTSDVFEFLYLLGGVTGGTWNWGLAGRVNGALLWPKMAAHFNAILSTFVGSAATKM